MKKYLPTWYIVKEIKFKRKHKIGYGGYIKKKYIKHYNNMSSYLYKKRYEDLVDYFIFAGLLFTMLFTGVIYTVGLGILLLINMWFPVSFLSILPFFSMSGLLPVIYSILCYPYFWTLFVFNRLFGIKTEKKNTNSRI